MHRSLRLASAASLLALAATPPGARAESPRLAAMRGRVTSQMQQLRTENRQMRDELAQLRALVEGLAARVEGGAPAAGPTPAAPSGPAPAARGPSAPSDDAPLSDEERALMAEFSAELGDEPASKAPTVPTGPRARAYGPAPGLRPTTPQSGRRNFWGVGGVPGQTNVIDVGLASEWIGSASTERGSNELTNKLQLRETELALGGYVDPYHRADVLLVWNGVEDEVELEEGFLTFFNLPEGFRARVGKFRSRTGRTNALHFADLPWVTLPKVNETFLGEEGFGQAGARLTYIGKPRGKHSWSMDLEIFGGDSETIVDPQGLTAGGYDGSARQDAAKSDKLLSGHLQHHVQFNEYDDLELGYSRINADNHQVKLNAVDMVLRRMLQPGRNEWKLHAEKMWQNRADLANTGDDDRDGWFASLHRRFDRNNEAFFRMESVDNITPGDLTTDSWSLGWTYYPTEFSWYRLQYQEDDFGMTGIKDKQVYLQFRWQIGVDRHALQ